MNTGLTSAGAHLDVILLCNFALGVVLPNLVALVTARLAGSSVKAVVLLLLSALAGLLTQVIAQSGVFHWKPALLSFGWTFLFSVASHYGLLKPVGMTGTNGAIQVNVPNGLGGSLTVVGSQPVAPDTGNDAPS